MKKTLRKIFCTFLSVVFLMSMFLVFANAQTFENATLPDTTVEKTAVQKSAVDAPVYPVGMGYDESKIKIEPCPEGTVLDISQGNIIVTDTEWTQGDNGGVIQGAVIFSGVNSTGNTIKMSGDLPKIVFRNINMNGIITITQSTDLDIGFYGNNVLNEQPGKSRFMDIKPQKAGMNVFLHSYDFKEVAMYDILIDPTYVNLTVDNLNVTCKGHSFISGSTKNVIITNSSISSPNFASLLPTNGWGTDYISHELNNVKLDNMLLSSWSSNNVDDNLINVTWTGNINHALNTKNLFIKSSIITPENLIFYTHSNFKIENSYMDLADQRESIFNCKQMDVKNSTINIVSSSSSPIQSCPIQFENSNGVFTIDNSSVNAKNLNNGLRMNVRPITKDNDPVFLHKIKIPDCSNKFLQSSVFIPGSNTNQSSPATLKTDNNSYLYYYLPMKDGIKVTLHDSETGKDYEANFNGTNTDGSITEVTPTIKTRPTIVAKSQDQVVSQNNTLTLYVVAIPQIGTDALYYQWYKNGVPITGATQSTYVVYSASAYDSGVYYCEVTEQNGGGVLSGTMNVTIDRVVDPNAPIIHGQAATLNLVQGSDVTLYVEAQSSGGQHVLTYQWYKDKMPLAGQISSFISITNIDASKAGVYYCVVTDTVLNSSAQSAPVTIMIK